MFLLNKFKNQEPEKKPDSETETDCDSELELEYTDFDILIKNGGKVLYNEKYTTPEKLCKKLIKINEKQK